mmetsp:Transcript_23287/g.47633  ORF Transcript_23287/g.47633 Transcript_23287/m.47633 type:complete len:411 (+) Transcript_23287:99-1331(+)
MTTPEIALKIVADLRDDKTKADQYLEILEKTLGIGDVTSILVCVDHLTSEEVPQAISRKVMGHMALCVKKMLTGEKFEEVASHTVRRIHSQNMAQSMEEADEILRTALFESYKRDGDFASAAHALAGISLENSSRVWISPEEKATAIADHYVKVAEVFNLAEETVDAENYVNKANGFMNDVMDSRLRLRYKMQHGSVMDSNRKFNEASVAYYELSQTPPSQIKADDLLVLLGKAATCAILGKAGPQRDRILGSLFKDERLGNLEQVDGFATHAQVVTKMYQGFILRRTELRAFEEGLKDHQKAVMADGLTIPQRAIIEHNMAAAFKVYENIRIEELGILLEISVGKAETIAARMISEGRLSGYIDQIDGVLYFVDDRDALKNWDGRISELCVKVNKMCEEVDAAYPELTP